jgi:chorismate synthase
MNSFGTIFKLTTFGESHGVAIGGVIEGAPAGFKLDLGKIQSELDKRKPGQSAITTQRKESDKVQFLSGIFEKETLGTPIGFIINNEDNEAKDYNHLKENYRPSHADYTYQEKYGVRDYRGGGRSSARETACRVVAGAIAKQFLSKENINVQAFVSQVGNVKSANYKNLDLSLTEQSIVKCPDKFAASKMISLIEQVKADGDSVGGKITGVITGLPVGFGEPVFDKLHAQLGKAMLSINAVKGFEYGSGFDAVSMRGSQHNDCFVANNGKISTKSNNSGGIQGGISNGEDVYFNVAFKPVATIMQKQQSVNDKGENIELDYKGRHDPCVVPRAVAIVEAMASITIFDFFLRNKLVR